MSNFWNELYRIKKDLHIVISQRLPLEQTKYTQPLDFIIVPDTKLTCCNTLCKQSTEKFYRLFNQSSPNGSQLNRLEEYQNETRQLKNDLRNFLINATHYTILIHKNRPGKRRQFFEINNWSDSTTQRTERQTIEEHPVELNNFLSPIWHWFFGITKKTNQNQWVWGQPGVRCYKRH